MMANRDRPGAVPCLEIEHSGLICYFVNAKHKQTKIKIQG